MIISSNVKTMFILFLASCFLTLCFKIYAEKRGLMAHPNERSSHEIPTPNGGGVVFAGLWILYVFYNYLTGTINLHHLTLFVSGPFLVTLVGFLDDHREISVFWRFFIYLFAATIGVFTLSGNFTSLMMGRYLIQLGAFGPILAVLAIFYSINIFNFIDGIDGIASLEAIFIFGVGGYLLYHAGGYTLAFMSWGVVAVVLGFLVWNFPLPRAQIFMGDVGSVFLGFLVAIFALAGERWYQVPSLFWVMLYGVAIFDPTMTMIRRMLNKEQWWLGHRKFAFQRLQNIGWSHRKILAGTFIINIFLSLMVLWADQHRNNLILVAFFAAFLLLTIVYLLIEKVAPMYKKAKKVS
jgi:Fuc2NAc and GlcNAc transferase